MENFFSRLTLDIIGKAVFDYDFDSLTHDDPVIKVRHAPANRCCFMSGHASSWMAEAVAQYWRPQSGFRHELKGRHFTLAVSTGATNKICCTASHPACHHPTAL